jgi:phage terminase large subunit-like protein
MTSAAAMPIQYQQPPAFRMTADQKSLRALSTVAYTRILAHGGSRSGKTFEIVREIVIRALKAPGSRHLITRFHFRDAKIAIFMDTLPKVLALCFPDLKGRVDFNRTDFFVRFPNGSEIWIGGLDDKERTEKILGLEYATIYFNESSQISFHAVETALTRLAQKCPGLKNKAYFDCNPPTKSHWLYPYFFQKVNPETKIPHPFPALYAQLQMNPEGNRANLPDGYIEQELGGLSERKRRRFKEGEWLDDVEGALWTRPMIDAARVVHAPQLVRVVVGIDPAVTAKEGSNSTGIVVAGTDARGHFYVLADNTQERASPATWGTAAVTAYDDWKADAVIGETNNGGDLVEMNIKRINPHVRYKGVHASRGKIVRAEPIAGLYEQGRVHHVGEFPELEDQMCSFAPLMQDQADSPDRMDALVWAITELSGNTGGHIRATGRTIGART